MGYLLVGVRDVDGEGLGGAGLGWGSEPRALVRGHGVAPLLLAGVCHRLRAVPYLPPARKEREAALLVGFGFGFG